MELKLYWPPSQLAVASHASFAAVCRLLLVTLSVLHVRSVCAAAPSSHRSPIDSSPAIGKIHTHHKSHTKHTHTNDIYLCVYVFLCYPWNSLTCAHCKVLCLPTDNRQFCPFLRRRRCCCSLAIVINKL